MSFNTICETKVFMKISESIEVNQLVGQDINLSYRNSNNMIQDAEHTIAIQ